MKSFYDETRANLFDQWVGEKQALLAVELGVGESVLDVGCGIGQFTPLFLKKFKRVVGLDPNPEYLNEARGDVEYVIGYGETFNFEEKFDTISMNNLLEHVDDPVVLLQNCKKHLNKDGIIIVQVPNSNSIARRLGVLMGIIPSIDHISDKERSVYGHKRTYTLESLEKDVKSAGLNVQKKGGLLWKPLPNEMLLKLCEHNTSEWRDNFINTLIRFGEDRPDECAQIYIAAGL